jgi:hypothetical protein
VRLDNYVYTLESFRAVRDHLKAGGSVIAYHMSPKAYIAAKVFQLVGTAFEQVPLAHYYQRNLFNLTVVAGAGAGRDVAVPAQLLENVQLPTDNWPYLYLREPTIPTHYLVALGGVLAIAALFIGLALPRAPRITSVEPRDAALFGTGLGFLLLESKSVTEMSLLFGATWTVNLLVFAALIFALLFRDHPFPTRGLGINLMGAIVGGLFEYSAMALGIKALYLIAAITYLGTLLAVLRGEKRAANTTRIAAANPAGMSQIVRQS